MRLSLYLYLDLFRLAYLIALYPSKILDSIGRILAPVFASLDHLSSLSLVLSSTADTRLKWLAGAYKHLPLVKVSLKGITLWMLLLQ